jgi:hypothetical protein
VVRRQHKQKFHFNFAFVLRFIIFVLIVYFSISYFSNSTIKINLPIPNVLGTTIKYLPSSSQETLKNLPSSPVINFLQDKVDYIKKISGDFPQKQITEIKKMVVQSIYQNIMKSIENPAK